MKKKIYILLVLFVISFSIIFINLDIEYASANSSSLPTENWGLKSARIYEAQQYKNKYQDENEEILIGILDTGIDGKHPALINSIYTPKTGSSLGHKDFTNNAVSGGVLLKTPTDGHGHGTHIAGIIAADLQENGFVGIASNVKLISLK